MSEPLLGIDIGTENVRAVIFRNGSTKAVEDENGKPIWPAMIVFNQNGLRLFGNLAKTDNTALEVNSIKSPRKLLDDSAVRVFGAELGDGIQHLPINASVPDKIYPETYLAMVIKNIKDVAESQSSTIKKAVIAVPSWYTYNQRLSMEAAGLAAGFEQVVTVPSPSATAIAYSQKHNIVSGTKIVLALDIGAGSVSLSLFALSSGTVQILKRSTIDDLSFCGRNVTSTVADLIRQRVQTTDEKLIAAEATTIKKNLSVAESARTSDNLQREPIQIYRNELEHRLNDTLDDLSRVISSFLEYSRMRPSQIEEIVLIGGGSRVPCIRKRIDDMFPEAIIRQTLNVDEAVAQGAAFYAAKTFYPNKIGLNFYDVVTSDFSVDLRGEQRLQIVRVGAPLYSYAMLELRDYVGTTKGVGENGNGHAENGAFTLWEDTERRGIKIGSTPISSGTLQVSIFGSGAIALEKSNTSVQFDAKFFFGKAIDSFKRTLTLFDDMDMQAADAEYHKNRLAEEALKCENVLKNEKRFQHGHSLEQAVAAANQWLEENSASRVHSECVNQQIELLQNAHKLYRDEKLKYDTEFKEAVKAFKDSYTDRTEQVSKCIFGHLRAIGENALAVGKERFPSRPEEHTLEEIRMASDEFQIAWNKYYEAVLHCTTEHRLLREACERLEKLLEIGYHNEDLDLAVRRAREIIDTDLAAEDISRRRDFLVNLARPYEEDVATKRTELLTAVYKLIEDSNELLRGKRYDGMQELKDAMEFWNKTLDPEKEPKWKILNDGYNEMKIKYDRHVEMAKQAQAEANSKLEVALAELSRSCEDAEKTLSEKVWPGESEKFQGEINYAKRLTTESRIYDIEYYSKRIMEQNTAYAIAYDKEHVRKHEQITHLVADLRKKLPPLGYPEASMDCSDKRAQLESVFSFVDHKGRTLTLQEIDMKIAEIDKFYEEYCSLKKNPSSHQAGDHRSQLCAQLESCKPDVRLLKRYEYVLKALENVRDEATRMLARSCYSDRQFADVSKRLQNCYQNYQKYRQEAVKAISDAKIALTNVKTEAEKLLIEKSLECDKRTALEKCFNEAIVLLHEDVTHPQEIDMKTSELKGLVERVIGPPVTNSAHEEQGWTQIHVHVMNPAGEQPKIPIASDLPCDVGRDCALEEHSISEDEQCIVAPPLERDKYHNQPEGPSTSQMVNNANSIQPVVHKHQPTTACDSATRSGMGISHPIPLPRAVSYDIGYTIGGNFFLVLKRGEPFAEYTVPTFEYDGSPIYITEKTADGELISQRLDIPQSYKGYRTYSLRMVFDISYSSGNLYIYSYALSTSTFSFGRTKEHRLGSSVFERQLSGRYIKY